jgi:hypothetical protein
MSHPCAGSWICKSIFVLAATTATGIGVHAAVASAHGRTHHDEPRTIESPDCRRVDTLAARSTEPAQISVSVPATTILRIDKHGRVIAAATNTGCVPSRSDDVFVFRPDGTLAPTNARVIDRCDWRGDFTVSGRYQPQDCNAH